MPISRGMLDKNATWEGSKKVTVIRWKIRQILVTLNWQLSKCPLPRTPSVFRHLNEWTLRGTCGSDAWNSRSTESFERHFLLVMSLEMDNT